MGGVGGGVICESCDPISQFCQILSAEMLSSVSAACIPPNVIDGIEGQGDDRATKCQKQ